MSSPSNSQQPASLRPANASLPSQNRPPLRPPGPSMGARPQSRHSSQQHAKGPRKNDRIRVNEVRLISPEGKPLGIVPTRDALALAKQYGFDLVEISPNANPPVCRIIDFGKYMYDESKNQKNTKKNLTKLKEIKMRPGIEAHDYDTKLRHAAEFLEEGDKVKVTMTFRGREMERTPYGFEIINRFVKDLESCGKPDAPAKLVGRNITLTFSPVSSARSKSK